MKNILTILCLFISVSCAQMPANEGKLDSNIETLKRIAKKVKASGNAQAAIQLESKLISMDENNPENYIDLAKSLRELELNEQAVDLLYKAEEIIPGNESIKLALAKSLIAFDKPEAAIGELETVKSLRNVDYFNVKGIAFDMIEDYTSAQATYREGLQVLPNNGALLNNLALSQILNKQYGSAIAILEKLNKRGKVDEKYRHNLALAYGLNKQDKKAYNLLLRDLSKAQAKENLDYYKDFR